jgi:hypothetical protein
MQVASVGIDVATHEGKQRALATAVATDQADTLAGVNHE